MRTAFRDGGVEAAGIAIAKVVYSVGVATGMATSYAASSPPVASTQSTFVVAAAEAAEVYVIWYASVLHMLCPKWVYS